MKDKLVIFDFDGVIVNTHDVSFGLNQKTNPHLTPELYSQMSHGNFYASFESDTPLLKFIANPTFSEEYGRAIQTLPPPQGINEMIVSLSKNHHLSIVSSADETCIANFLKKEELVTYFNEILGANVHKSKVIKLQKLLNKYDFKKEQAVFITDTLGDIKEAHEVGIKSIGVLWGLHDRETLARGNPEIIIDVPLLLEQTIEKVLNK